MQTKSDVDLLREYSVHRSDAAFGEIVQRYADVIYSAALRQVGNAEQARDVAQTTFIELARKAGSISNETPLIGWLYRCARFAALQQLRKDKRRAQRERHAMDWHDFSTETSSDWNVVRPVLDEAIGNLGNEDRDALLLRFFKNESLATVGATLGVSEDAAQKRVSRALGKLREFLAGRGITTSTAALSAALTVHAVQAAPAGFATTLAAGALASTATAGGSALSFLKLFTFATMKTTLLILALAAGAAAFGVIRFNSQRQLREARDQVQQQANELEALRAANERLASQANGLEQLRGDAQDVLRLRGEIARLRGELADRNRSADAGARTNATPDSSKAQVHIKAKFLVIPAAYAGGDATELLMGDQLNMVSERLEAVEGSRTISAPQVLTLSGNQARIRVGQSIPFNGVYTNIGLTLDVIPRVQANSSAIELTFDAQLRRLAGVDDELPRLEIMSVTNSISVPNGQTLTIVRRMESGKWLSDDSTDDAAQPRSLMIFLTPTIVKSDGNVAVQPVAPIPMQPAPPGVLPGVVAAQPRP